MYLKIKLIKRDISASYSSLENSILFFDRRGEFPQFTETAPLVNGDNVQEIFNQMNATVNKLRTQ